MWSRVCELEVYILLLSFCSAVCSSEYHFRMDYGLTEHYFVNNKVTPYAVSGKDFIAVSTWQLHIMRSE